MQKKKTAEAQIQQELSSGSSVMSVEAGAWMPAREPMTGTQAASLRRLAEELREPNAFDADLTPSEASRRICRVGGKIPAGQLPPHTD